MCYIFGMGYKSDKFVKDIDDAERHITEGYVSLKSGHLEQEMIDDGPEIIDHVTNKVREIIRVIEHLKEKLKDLSVVAREKKEKEQKQ